MNVVSPELSLVIPCFNEGKVLPLLHQRLVQSLGKICLTWEVIFVDDGSKDDTYGQLAAIHASDGRFKVLAFSRNFGHQTAVFAGLSYAHGEFVAVLDADLQDPPEFVATCVAKLKEGYDVVFAVRRQRKENVLKRFCYAAFYRLLNAISEIEIPLDSGDFCVMRQPVVAVLRSLPERNVFVRGLRAWSGFRQIGIEYARDSRAAGEPKYSFRKLLGLAFDGVFAFSPLPLRLATYLGFASLGISALATVFVATWKIAGFEIVGRHASDVPGWTSLICVILFLGGIQFMILGCMGEYIGRVYNEVKQRPRWIIRNALGLGANEDLTQREDRQRP